MLLSSLAGLLQASSACAAVEARRAAWAPAAPCRRSGRWGQLRLYASATGSSGSSHAATPDASGREAKRLTILHFNDVYNIEQRMIEPVGGAARFKAAARAYEGDRPLTLFSGDCLNPSLMSAFTRGEQMVPVLNCIGVHAAAVGNHDFDFGTATLQQHMRAFQFPWLCSNVLDARSGQPLGGAERSRIIEWQGVKVGLMGLVEREWLLTIPSIEESSVTYLDFCEEGRRLAGELAAQARTGLLLMGAELIVALTHMRTPNDLVLASKVPEIQLILGGHDHHWEFHHSEPHGTLVLKSGTDFREFSILRVEVPDSVAERPAIDFERVEINSQVPEDPEMAGIVKRYLDLIGTKLDEPLGWALTDLDARFDTVRRAESNVASMFADIMRISLGAQISLMNGGTLRSDQVHAAGQLLTRDFLSILPFTDELVLLELSGADVLAALETGVSSYPALEGRFLQVSGVAFAFDPEQPSGSRVVPGSVTVAGRPLDLTARYKVATKNYLRGGKDGFSCLAGTKVLVDGETNPRLATLVQYLLMRVELLNETLAEEWHRMVEREAAAQAAARAAMAEAQSGDHPSVSSIDAWETWESHAKAEPAASAAISGDGETAVATAGRGGSTLTAVYAPGDPSAGTFTGGPGSIPQEVEDRVHEASTTGAAISLALLLQQRSELQEAASVAAGGHGGSGSDSDASTATAQWVAVVAAEEEAKSRHSSAALSALSYLEPCTHGLDELIVFDAFGRKFGISPQVEGRIRCVPGGKANA